MTFNGVEIPKHLCLDAEGQLSCYAGKIFYDLIHALRSAYEKRLRVTLISHGQKQSGESADVIGMEVSQQDGSDLAERKTCFLHCKLSTLAAVNKQTYSVVSHIAAAEESVQSRNGSACAR